MKIKMRNIAASMALVATVAVVGSVSPAAAQCNHFDELVGFTHHDWRYHAYGRDYHKDQTLGSGVPARWVAHGCGHNYS